MPHHTCPFQLKQTDSAHTHSLFFPGWTCTLHQQEPCLGQCQCNLLQLNDNRGYWCKAPLAALKIYFFWKDCNWTIYGRGSANYLAQQSFDQYGDLYVALLHSAAALWQLCLMLHPINSIFKTCLITAITVIHIEQQTKPGVDQSVVRWDSGGFIVF